jgi:hypothetical protein
MNWPAQSRVQLLIAYRYRGMGQSLAYAFISDTPLIFMRWPRLPGIMSHEGTPRTSLHSHFSSEVVRTQKLALLLYMEGTFEECIENAKTWDSMHTHDVHIFTDTKHESLLPFRIQQHHIHDLKSHDDRNIDEVLDVIRRKTFMYERIDICKLLMLKWGFEQGYEYVCVFDCIKNKASPIPNVFFEAASFVGVIFGAYFENWAYVAHSSAQTMLHKYLETTMNQIDDGIFDDGDLLSAHCYDTFPKEVSKSVRVSEKFKSFLNRIEHVEYV